MAINEKFIGYFRLLEACGAPGCPVCRRVRDESHHHLESLLYEQVTDPDTRRDIRAAWGLCNWHTWMLLEVDDSLFGASIIYEDLLGLVLRRLGRHRDGSPRARFGAWLAARGWGRRLPRIVELYRRRRICPVCAVATDTGCRCLLAMLKFVDDPELQLAYARSEGLCLPHTLQAIELGGGTSELRALLDRTHQKWAKLREDLETFVRKHDYRNREPFTEAETASYMRAFEMLAGAKGLFGNQLEFPGGKTRRKRAGEARDDAEN